MQEVQVLSLEKDMANHSRFLPGEFQGQRSLVGYSPWGCKESDMTERLNKQQNLSTMIQDSAKATGKLMWEPATFTLFQDCSPNFVQCSGKEEHLFPRELGHVEYEYFMTIPE